MKKIITVILLIILIPYITVTYFIKDENINFNSISNDVVRLKRSKTNIIEEIPFEEYVSGVLSGEMPASFEEEALKAQAVAARTYVLNKINTNKNKDYDVVDTTDDQVYLDEETLKTNWGKNYQKNYNKIKEAVIETKGQYLTYNDEIIKAFFFSTSNGKTENCEDVFTENLPYLKSVDSNWDSKTSPVFNTTTEISLSDFYTKLNLQYEDKLNYKIIDYTTSGSIKNIEINNIKLKATDVRYKLGLRSTSFELKQVESNIIITTKGNGHGVGMSQYGAQGMAKEGYKYDQILKHYYTDVEIKKL